MKKTLIALCALTLSSAAFAGNWTHQQIGNFGFYNGSDGSHYTTNTIGNFTFWNGTDGCGGFHSGFSNRIGNFTFGTDGD